MQRGGWCWIGVLLTLFLSRSGTASPLQLTMDEAVARAQAANLDLSVGRRDIDVARANLERSKALMPSNPFLTGGAQHSTSFGRNYMFLLSQEVEVAAQRSKRIAAAAQGVEKATWEQKSAEQGVAATVKTAFIHALVSADGVTIAQKNVALAAVLSSELAGDTQPSDAQRIDLNVAHIQESRARREVAAAQRAHDDAVAGLRRLLGLPHGQAIELVGAPRTDVQELPPTPELIDRALRQRPDLAALQHDLQRADLQLTVTKREAIPNFTLSGTMSQFEGDTLVGGEISFPIPVFQRKTGDIQEAAAERSRATLQGQRLEQVIAQEVADARRACIDAGDDLQTQQRDIVPKSEENLELERGQYERGDVTLADFIGVQADLLSARRDYLDAVQTYNESLIELERLVGGPIETPAAKASSAAP